MKNKEMVKASWAEGDQDDEIGCGGMLVRSSEIISFFVFLFFYFLFWHLIAIKCLNVYAIYYVIK